MKKTKLLNNRLITLIILFVIAILNFPVGNTFALDTTPILGTAIVSNTSNLIYFTSATYNANVVISDPDPENSNARQISGYAWSVDLGWIEFTDNTTPGVYVDYTTGEVSGSAYVLNTENILDFDNYGSNVVFDDETGILSGFVWSEDVGWVDFGSGEVYMQDVFDPTGSVGINSGDTYTTTTSVTLNITGADQAPSQGIDEMMVCNDAGFSGCSWESYHTGTSVFSSDFETGDISRWDDSTVDVYSTLQVQDVVKLNGTYALEIALTGDSEARHANVQENFSSEVTSYYTKFNVYIPADYTGPVDDWDFFRLLTLSDSSWDWRATVDLRGTDALGVRIFDVSGSQTEYNDTLDLEFGRWHEIEFYQNIDSTEGSFKLWLNGEERLSASSIDTGNTGVEHMYVGPTYVNCELSDTLYFDDIEVFEGEYQEFPLVSKPWTLASGDGEKTVYLKLRDAGLNESTSYSDTITLDSTGPTGSVSVNGGDTYTETANVDLTISASDTSSGIDEMMVCNDAGFSGCSWEPYSTTKSWTLTSGEGIKTVSIKFRDTLDNESTTYNDTITLDTTGPTGNPVFYSDGTTDSTFGLDLESIVSGVLLQEDGKILVIEDSIIVERLDPDGSLDATFGWFMADMIVSFELQPDDGKVLIGGSWFDEGVARAYLARLETNGSLDMSFDSSMNDENEDPGIVFSTAVQSDGKILIGGVFSTYGGVARNSIARLNSDGSLDTSFDPGIGPSGIITTTHIQPDGKILIGGAFSTYNGVDRQGIARLNVDGSLDTTFDSTSGIVFEESISDIDLDPEGKVLIAGDFQTYGGTPRNYIARLNSDGSLDTTFDPSVDSGVDLDISSVVAQPDGKILIGGSFQSIGGVSRYGIARLNNDGTLDTTFESATLENDEIYSIVTQSDGKVLVVGETVGLGGIGRLAFAGDSPTIGISVNDGDTYTTTTSVDLTISASDTYSGIDEMMVCNDAGFSGCSWESYSTTKSWTLTSGDGEKTVYIKYRDTLDNESTSYSDTITLDSTGPTGSVSVNSGDTYTETANVDLTISASDTYSGIDEMMVCNDAGFSGCSWESYSTTKSWTLTSGDGEKTVYIKFRDTLDNESTSYSDTITLDSTGPTGSVSVNGGDTYTETANVDLTISASDTSSGIDEMMVCNDAGFSGCTWEPYSTTKSWTLTSGDEEKTVYIKFRDTLDNESTTYSDTITLESVTPDSGTIEINTGDTITTSRNVTLTLSATDPAPSSGLTHMMICNVASFSGCTWESYSTSKSWELSSGDGTKTVSVKYRDGAGNESSTYNDTITLDSSGPVGNILINEGAPTTTTNEVSLSIEAADTISDVSQMIICSNASFSGCSWEPYSTTKSWTLTSEEGIKTVYIRFKDTLGNESSTYTDNIIYDTTAPSGSITINSGASSTTSPNVTLTLSGTDTLSGVSQMIICNDASFSGCTWESYSTSKSWALTDGNGTKTVYVKYKDGIGLVSTIYSDTIELSIPEPPVVTYTPPVVEEEEVEEEEPVEEEEGVEEETTTEEPSEEETTYETEVKQVSGVTEYSELKVRVKDDEGKPLANTLVTMANQSQMTDLEGIATFTNVRAGDYKLEYEYDGKKEVKSVSIENLDVQDGEKVVLNVMEINPEEEKSSTPIFYLVLIPILLLIILTVLRKKKNYEEIK